MVVVPSPYSFRLALQGRSRATDVEQVVAVFAHAAELCSAVGLAGKQSIAWQPPDARKARSASVRGRSANAVAKIAPRVSASGEVSAVDTSSDGAPGERFSLAVTTGFVDGHAVPPRLSISFVWTTEQRRSAATTDALLDASATFVEAFGAASGAGWFNAHQTEADPYADVCGIVTAKPSEILGYSFIVALTHEARARLSRESLPCETVRTVTSRDGATTLLTALRRAPQDVDDSVVREWRAALQPVLVARGNPRSSYIQPRPWMLLPEDWPADAPDAVWSQLHSV